MKKKYPRILILAILSLITALVWGVSDVVRSFFFKKPEIKVSTEVLAPLDPTLDKQTLDAVQNALYFDPSQIVTVTATPSSSPKPSPTSQPVVSVSPSPKQLASPQENLITSPSP